MNASNPSGGIHSVDQRLSQRLFRQRNSGRNVSVAFLFLLTIATFVIVGREREEPAWAWMIFVCLFGSLAVGSLVWREVTVDAEARVTLESWCLLGVLPMWKRQRNLREFAAVRSQRVEVVRKGDRRVYCDVYLVAGVGNGKRLDVERLEMGEEGGCPEGIAVGRDLAQLTGLPFEDKT